MFLNKTSPQDFGREPDRLTVQSFQIHLHVVALRKGYLTECSYGQHRKSGILFSKFFSYNPVKIKRVGKMSKVINTASLRVRCFQNHREKGIHFWWVLFLDGLFSNLEILCSYATIVIRKFFELEGKGQESSTTALPSTSTEDCTRANKKARCLELTKTSLYYGQSRRGGGKPVGPWQVRAHREHKVLGALRKCSLGSFHFLCFFLSVVHKVLGALLGNLWEQNYSYNNVKEWFTLFTMWNFILVVQK